MLSKKYSVITLVLLALVGSFIMFYATNLLMYDVGLNTYGFQELSIISTLPLFMIGLSFVAAFMYVLKSVKYQNSQRKVLKTYSIVIASFALVGLITSILTATTIYKGFFAPYPFPGYGFVCLLGNLALIALAALCFFVFSKKIPEDTEENKIKVKTVFKALGLGFVIFFAFDRFGSLLWAPSYLQARSLYITWIFFVFMCVPLLTVIYVAFDYFGYTLKEFKARKIFLLVTIGIHVVFAALTLIIGATNPLFVSAVSNAIGLERLASMPVVVLLMVVGYTAFFVVQIVKLLKLKKAQ